MPVKFEDLGFHIDYFLENKYLVSIKSEKNIHPNEKIGYASTEFHKADTDIIIGKKKIKKGTEYKTIIWPLCGKISKN